MAKRHLKGITWDHPRGYNSLAEPLVQFHAQHPDIEVRWDRRTLREFGEAPLEVLAARYDLIVIDHPFCGRAMASGCLRDLRPLLPSDQLTRQLQDSVGPSTASYHYGGCVWALPTDAAAQVACWREDLLHAWGLTVPDTWTQVLDLAREVRRHGAWMAIPCVPIDAVCTFLTLTANLGAPLAETATELPDRAVCEEALRRMQELIALAHPLSLKWNPIQAYEVMVSCDELAYIPLAFGYSNYAREGVSSKLRFGGIALPGRVPGAASILGGAGCAISYSCGDVDAALAYLTFVHDPLHQRGAYMEAGGQPGSRAAWEDPHTNALTNGYFRDTLPTLDQAYLRPRFDGFIPFFEAAGHVIASFLREAQPVSRPLSELDRLYAAAVETRDHCI